MFSGQVYDQVKDYLNYYLFGFDKSQLQCSLLNGAIHLDNCNLKPAKAEKILEALGVPFSLKAGMIGRLELKMNLLSGAIKWIATSDSQTIRIKLSNVYFILGASMKSNSKDDSFIEETEQELLEPYDENNCFNIFSNNLKLRKKRRLNHAKTPPDQPIPKEVREVFQSVQITIEKLHIRYEDDYFSQAAPYSWGIVIEVSVSPLIVQELSCETSKLKQVFSSLAQFKPTKVDLGDFQRREGYDKKNLASILKDFTVKGLRVYWNCFSEMFVPTSLWEQTSDYKYQIFEALDAQQLTELMQQVFGDQKQRELFQYILEKCDAEVQILHLETETQNELNSSNFFDDPAQQGITKAIHLQVHTSPLKLNLTPHVLNDMLHFKEHLTVQSLLKDLKQYRPNRKPITNVPEKHAQRYALKRKRRLIVRDWFFFVVWYIRLRKILQGAYQKEAMNNFLLFNPRYSTVLQAFLENPSISPQELRELIADNSELKERVVDMKFRLESVQVCIFKEQLFAVKQKNCPQFELLAQKLALDVSSSQGLSEDEKQTSKARVETIQVFTYHKSNDADLRKPQELRPIAFKQNVEVHQTREQFAVNMIPKAPSARPIIARKESHSLREVTVHSRGPLRQRPPTTALQKVTLQPERQSYQYMETEYEQEFDSVVKKHLPNITSPSRLMIDRLKNEGGLLRMHKKLDDSSDKSLSESQMFDRLGNEPIRKDSKTKRFHEPAKNGARDTAPKDSLVQTVVDSVMSFPIKFLDTVSRQKEDRKGQDLQKQGFITTRKNSGVFPTNSSCISALEKVRISPAQQNFSLKNKPVVVTNMQRLDMASQRKQDAVKDIEQFNMMIQGFKCHKAQKIPDSASRGITQANEQKTANLTNTGRHKFVQSELHFEGDQFNLNGDLIQMSEANCEAEENEFKSRNRSGNRLGPNEGIRNKNVMANDSQSDLRDSKQNLLGKLLSKPKTSNYSSNQGHQTQGSTALLTNHNSSFSQNDRPPTGQRMTEEVKCEQKVQTVQDRTLNSLPYVKVMHTEQRANVPIEIYRQQLLTITQRDNCSFSLVHEITFSKKNTSVISNIIMGSAQVSYSSAVIKALFELLLVTKEAKELPMLRDLELRGTPVTSLLDLLRPAKVIGTVSSDVQRQADNQMVRHLVRLAGTVDKNCAENLNFVAQELKSAKFDLRLDAGRFYFSLFQQDTRDQLAKFVSPQVAISLIKDREEVQCEIFGFVYQQTADIGALQTFASNLHSHVSMLAQNPAIMIGSKFYEDMLCEYKKKQDEKLYLAQKALVKARQANGTIRQGLSGAASPKMGDDTKERGASAKQSFNINQEFQFQQFKSKLKNPPHKAVAPKATKSPKKNSMVSSTLLLQELNSKKGDLNNLEDIIADQTESENGLEYTRTHQIDTEPALRILGDQDDRTSDEQQQDRLSVVSEDTPRMKSKARVSGQMEQPQNFGQPVLKNVDGRITLTFTQITTSVPSETQIQFCQQPGEIYMNFEKEGERKMPQKSSNPFGVRASQKKGNMQNLFKKALQVKSGRISQSTESLLRRTRQNDQDEPQQDGEERCSTQRDIGDLEEQPIPTILDDEDSESNYNSQGNPEHYYNQIQDQQHKATPRKNGKDGQTNSTRRQEKTQNDISQRR